MSTLPFDIVHDGPVAKLTLSNPEKRNAMGIAFWKELPRAIEEIDRSGETRAIVVTSTGPHFSSGLDLASFASINNDPTATNAGLSFLDLVSQMQGTFSALENVRVPVIASIQGGCIGAGVDMVTACDIRMCTADAYFTIYEIEIGMTADVGTFPRILNHLPEGLVRELAYTGRKFSADEAMAHGLVNRVLADQDACDDAAMSLAQEIASKAPMAVHGCKRAITYSRDHTTAQALEWIGVWNASMLRQSELMAAMAAKATGKAGDFAPLPPLKELGD